MTMKTFAPLLFLLASHTALGKPIMQIITRSSDLLAEYDYVIVGGGTAGLTVADRLTELPNISVLVLEAGGIPGATDERYLVPRRAGEAGTGNTFPFTSQPMTELNGRTAALTVPRVLGGGSAINGMQYDRGSAGDYNSWAELIGDEGWAWKNFVEYFKKAETFTPPEKALADSMGITYNVSVHGTSGPVHASFTPFMYETAKYFVQAAKEKGLPIPIDHAGGSPFGAFFSTQSLHGTKRERSYARNTHHTLAEPRSNYHVLASVTSTKLINEPGSDGKPNLTGVEYVPTSANNYQSAQKTVVKAKREIILAAGAVNTPRLLMNSGIGPKTHLDSLGVKTIIDLPGVGENFQDHPFYFMGFSASKYRPSSPIQDRNQAQQMAAQIEQMYRQSRTGPWTLSSPNVLAYWTFAHVGINTNLLTTYAADAPERYLRSGLSAKVIAGYKRQRDILFRSFRDSTAAPSLAFIDAGSGFESLRKPLSRGYIRIRFSDPLAAPEGDFRTFTHPLDRDMTLATIKWLQSSFWLQAPSLRDGLGSAATSPQPGLSDSALLTQVKQNLSPSMFHLSGTCAMMKEEEGGCVDARLRVYGTGGRVRVVDASIMPIVPQSHTQSTVYALAEKASDLIKEDIVA